MEKERKWDELNKDCLVQIFARVGPYLLIRSVQLVCKSWYNATFDPGCWTSLVFYHIYSTGIVTTFVSRSQRSATSLVFNNSCTKQELLYISNESPALKSLALSRNVLSSHGSLIGDLIGTWKNLEMLHIDFSRIYLGQFLKSVSIHCKHFVGLELSCCDIEDEDAMAIVEFVPKIKYLNINSSTLSEIGLHTILNGCMDLEVLDVSECDKIDAGVSFRLNSKPMFSNKSAFLIEDADLGFCYKSLFKGFHSACNALRSDHSDSKHH